MEPEFEDVPDVAPRPAKRFKHQSHKQALKQVHLAPAISRTQFDHEIEDNDSHFHEALLHWRELNLSPSFLSFSSKADGLSASMALLLHHWREVVQLWLDAMDASDEEGLKALLDLFQKLSHDLRDTIQPMYYDALERMTKLLPRTIPADTLTILLETLSVVFKYVAIPAEEIEKTWEQFVEVLPKCDPEVQRAVAELWGSTLRRLKVAVREKFVVTLVSTASTDVGSWVFVSACKSVSQTLHTTTPTLFSPLLRFHLSCEEPESSFTVIRRLLTASIHHCKSSDQFAPLANLLVEEFNNSPKEDSEILRRLLDIITVACSIRQGSRMGAKHLSTLLLGFEYLPLTDRLHAVLLKYAASCLTAGDMALWMGPGRKVLARVWERPTLALELFGVLSSLNWGGWKLLAQSQVLKTIPDLLDTHTEKALELLDALQKEKRLQGMDAQWKERLQVWVQTRLGGWTKGTEQAKVLHYILGLSELLPSLGPILVTIVDATLSDADPRQEYEEQEYNSSWVLGSCLSCLSRRNRKEWEAKLDIVSWTATIVGKWAWSGYVLDGLMSLLNSTQVSVTTKIPFDTLYQHLEPSLLSHSRLLRLAVLRLLTSRVVEEPASAEVLKRCLQGEEVDITVQGVRERVLRIGRMNHVLKDGDDVGANVAVKWLIAQLKVNLRPLWSPTVEALATVAERFDELTWRLLFEQLCSMTLGHFHESQPAWMTLEDKELDAISEAEKSWRDPSAHKLRCSITIWLSEDTAQRSIVSAQADRDRFDEGNFELQLLSALAGCSSLAEKHNRDLIPHFLSLAPPDAPTKLARHKLSAWLTLFSKFVNPKALRSSDDLHILYTNLLSHPDRPLQKFALSCVLTFKSPALAPHSDMLYALLDDTRWRDQLTQFSLTDLEPQERGELAEVVIPLLFGVMLERKGRSKGADRRAAVLSAIGGCTEQELHTLVELMLSPINRGRTINVVGPYARQAIPDDVSEKQLVGFVTLLGDVVKNLGTRIMDRWPDLVVTLLDVVGHAQARLTSTVTPEDEEAEDEDEAEKQVEAEERGSPRALRTIRQLGLKRFADFFRQPVSYDFSSYLPEAFRCCISPRLPILDVENSQAPTALLQLFHVWSTRQETARYLVEYDATALPKIYDCLVATNVKPTVVSKVLDIVENLIGFSSVDEEFLNAVFKPHVELLLTNFATLMERTKGNVTMSDQLGRRQIAILSQLAPYLANAQQATQLLSLFTPVLQRPSKIVPEKTKTDIIVIIKSLLPLIPDLSDPASTVHIKTYALLSQLFQTLRSRPARIGLVSTFRVLAEIEPSLLPLAELLETLNAYSTRRMEEPDFEKRMNAFNTLNEKMHPSLTSKQWLPLLFNMLSLIQDPEELAIRTNSALAMKRFLDRVATADKEFETVFSKTLYPGLRNGLRSKNELVRAEILSVISYAVKTCEQIAMLQEMRVLLANGDDEASFFNNILHVQLHRRTRALRRLAEYCDEGTLRSSTLSDVFVPLVANFIAGGNTVDHTLVTEAINTTGKMARQLQWGPYYALIQQYLRFIRNKDVSERVYVRTLVALLDNFHFPMDIVVESDDAVDEQGQDVGDDGPDEIVVLPSITPKKQAHIAEVVNNRLLPSLIRHLEKREETDDSLRIPISIGIIKVATHLPQATREIQITRLLTTLSQVFRSKSQETRDLARDTLCKIAIILGPSYLPITLRELRGALLRGPHLHVLAYVTHALLVHVTSGDHASTFTQLDDCVNDVAHVSAEVIFGESGKDVQSEEFKTKMREVRSSSSKGLDSFALIAKHITPPKISSLLVPVRNILQHTETLKVMQQVEDLLRRIAGGLNANPHLTPKELLVLCHTLISQNAKFLKQVPKPKKADKRTRGDAITEMKRHLVVQADHYANNSFRFVIFGLDLFNTAFRRSRFDFQDTQIISRLEPMVSVIGNTLYSNHMQVVMSGLKAAAAIVRCPLQSIAKSLPVFIRQIIQVIKQTGSTEAEVVQMAFKSLAAILRDQPTAQVKEQDLVFLLELLSPDLEEPNRQASVFTMLKAIVARKFVVPEIYDLMDRVSEIMVTNQSPQVQEQCRGILLQFLLDYPQGKGRLRNHMTFFAKNLSYVYESGRRSVMELLSAVLFKFNPDLIREYSDLLFVALVLVITNDDSAKCREIASELVKSLFARLEEPQRRIVMTHIHSWSSQQAQPQLARVSSQIYGILIDHLQSDASQYASAILGDLNAILASSAKLIDGEEEEQDEFAMDVDIEWQTPYHALVACSKLLRACPDLTAQAEAVAWPKVITLLLFPHAWVRTASCRLLGLLFAAVPATAPREDLEDDSPFSVEGMEEVAKKSCLQLRSEHLDGPLSLQIVKNLFYIGKCFSMVEESIPVEDAGSSSDDDEDEGANENENEDADEDAEEKGDGKKHPLSWLFSKLSFQARSAYITRRNKSKSAENWSHQPLSAFRWFAAMVSFLPPEQVQKFLTHILSPLYRIVDDDTIRDPQMDDLKALAVELQELVQSKAGTTEFSEVYSRIRQNVMGVRRERRASRAVQKITNPGAASKRKMQRNVAKKDSRKRKGSVYAEGRGNFKRRKNT